MHFLFIQPIHAGRESRQFVCDQSRLLVSQTQDCAQQPPRAEGQKFEHLLPRCADRFFPPVTRQTRAELVELMSGMLNNCKITLNHPRQHVSVASFRFFGVLGEHLVLLLYVCAGCELPEHIGGFPFLHRIVQHRHGGRLE